MKLRKKRAFFGTFWKGGLGAAGRLLHIAEDLQQYNYDCYFFAEDAIEKFVEDAGFIPIAPPKVKPPRITSSYDYISTQRVVGQGAIFSNLNEFYFLRGYCDTEYLNRAFDARFRSIERINPDILFGYWSWETTLAARVMKRPLISIIQRALHPAGGGFAQEVSQRNASCVIESMNSLMSRYSQPPITSMEDLMIGDLNLVSGIPITDELPKSNNIVYCGPVLWQSNQGVSDLSFIPTDAKVAWIYASDALSWVGGKFIIEKIVPILVSMGYFILISSGGHQVPSLKMKNVFTTSYFAGDLAAKRANIVIGRGGHDLFWTAMMAGKPFFGVPPNTEWLDYVKCAKDLGVGDYIEFDNFSKSAVILKIKALTSSTDVKKRIDELKGSASYYSKHNSPIKTIKTRFSFLFNDD